VLIVDHNNNNKWAIKNFMTEYVYLIQDHVPYRWADFVVYF